MVSNYEKSFQNMNVKDSIYLIELSQININGKYSSWAKVEAGVPQSSILDPLLFLLYISDSSENLASNPKLFADDTPFFSVVKNVDASNIDLNNDLEKISERSF